MGSTRRFDLIRAEVNARLPEAQRIRPWGAPPFLSHRVLTTQSDVPQSNLQAVLNATVLIGIASAVVLAFLIGAVGASLPIAIATATSRQRSAWPTTIRTSVRGIVTFLLLQK
jgi:hypothetical protein